MLDQRVAAEKQNGVGTPYIPPMTRRLKCRIDPEQSPYTCVLPEHKPVRRGREMIDLLAVEEPKPKPAKIRAVSYEAAIDQSFKRMRSAPCAGPGSKSILSRVQCQLRVKSAPAPHPLVLRQHAGVGA